MVGYTFEVTNKKTGETYVGKRYAVSFDKNFVGEDAEPAVEKYGRSAFEVKMIAPFESIEKVDEAYEAMKKPAKKAKVEAEPVVEEDKPKTRKRKAVEE